MRPNNREQPVTMNIPRSTLSYTVSNKLDSLQAMKKMVTVALSMILSKRCSFDAANFNQIVFGLNTYPVIKKNIDCVIGRHVQQALHVIYKLIGEQQLKSFSFLLLKSDSMPFELLDNYRFKMKYANDIDQSVLDSQYDIGGQTEAILGELSKLLDEVIVYLNVYLQVVIQYVKCCRMEISDGIDIYNSLEIFDSIEIYNSFEIFDSLNIFIRWH